MVLLRPPLLPEPAALPMQSETSILKTTIYLNALGRQPIGGSSSGKLTLCSRSSGTGPAFSQLRDLACGPQPEDRFFEPIGC